MNQEFELTREDSLTVLKVWSGRGAQAVVPEGVEVIGEEAFAGRRALRAVTLPGTLRRIGTRAFQKCTALAEVFLPDSLEEIGTEAFNGCSSLEHVVWGEGLRLIRPRAFWSCIRLREVTLPASLRQIGSRAFEGCSSLERVALRNPGMEVDEYAFNETPYCNRLLALADRCMVGQLGATDACPPELVLPEGVTHIDLWAFSKSRIRTARLPSSLRTVGMCAFRDCKLLTEVSMSPNTYCNYRLRLDPGDGIFAGCSSLTRVILRGRLKNFTWYDASEPQLLRGFDPEKTFMGCTSLQSIVAWEVPLSAFPRVLKPYALNAFLEDADRDLHYAPQIADAYHEALVAMRAQLIARTQRDAGYALHQYLTSRRLIEAEEFDAILAHAAAHAEPQTIAALLAYQRQVLSPGGADALFDAMLGEL